jgi:mannose-6-phosphate isomerase-like protein (cupin superfamily)
MPQFIPGPTIIPVPGDKQIHEYVGGVNTNDTAISIAHMRSPSGWSEPGQRPGFTEYTLVLKGTMCVEHEAGMTEVNAGQAIVTRPGEWIRYSTPYPDGCEYVAICLPAFSPATVHRDPA